MARSQPRPTSTPERLTRLEWESDELAEDLADFRSNLRWGLTIAVTVAGIVVGSHLL